MSHAVANIKKHVVLLLVKMLVTFQLMLTNFEDFEYRSYIFNGEAYYYLCSS